MRIALYYLIQCTWGVVQSTLGVIYFIFYFSERHYFYHGAVVTEWNAKSSVSLGMFVFVTKEPYFYDKLKNEYTIEELSQRLLVHEYGHTIQSLILGPLYLIIIGIPSTLWGFLPCCNIKRKAKSISYFSFFYRKMGEFFGRTGDRSKINGELSYRLINYVCRISTSKKLNNCHTYNRHTETGNQEKVSCFFAPIFDILKNRQYYTVQREISTNHRHFCFAWCCR